MPAVVAHIVFWLLLPLGWLFDELSGRGVVVFVALWAVGMFGLSYLPHGAPLVSAYVAVLDIALVFLIFKGDVRLK